MPRPFVIIAVLLFLCTGTAADPPDAEFADWFRSLKEPLAGLVVVEIGHSIAAPYSGMVSPRTL